jgi:hypothetical protein
LIRVNAVDGYTNCDGELEAIQESAYETAHTDLTDLLDPAVKDWVISATGRLLRCETDLYDRHLVSISLISASTPG